MPRLLALEWDAREVRAVVATVRGETVVVEDAFAAPLDVAADADDATRTAQVSGQLAAALAAKRIGRVETLVAVSRSSVELRQLSLPPAPDDELPDMVRFQALREFNALGEDWPLDYVALNANPAEPRNVLAIAISPAQVDEINSVCEAASLKPSRLLLRPYAAASLFLRGGHSSGERVRLLVDLLGDEADLTVIVGDSVVFLRTARLVGHGLSAAEAAPPLIAEIRRTLAAVHNQLAGDRIEAIYLCGGQPEHVALAERIAAGLDLPAKAFDVFEGVELGRDLKGKVLDNAGRYAPLLGMLVDEAAGGRHAVDFLHPRRRPAPPNRRRQWVLAAAAAAALVAAVGGAVWLQFRSLDNEIAALEAQTKELDASVKKAAELDKELAVVDGWLKHDVIWLDEIARVAEKLPASEDAMLTQLGLMSHPDGGIMNVEGLVKTAATVVALEDALRDQAHRVEGQGRQQYEEQRPYTWKFQSSMIVAPSGNEPPPDEKQPQETVAKTN